jgi:hypothetical protein
MQHACGFDTHGPVVKLLLYSLTFCAEGDTIFGWSGASEANHHTLVILFCNVQYIYRSEKNENGKNRNLSCSTFFLDLFTDLKAFSSYSTYCASFCFSI